MLGDNHYIHRLRVSCLKHPQFHRHQLLALDHELALATNSTDIDHYLAQSRNLLELARASLLDRAANSLSNAHRYDDPWIAAATGIEYLAALKGENHVELYTHLLAGQQAAAPLRVHSALVQSHFQRLFLGLLHIHTSHQNREEVQLAVGLDFNQLCSADPLFVVEDWISRPRYRLRLPWPEAPLHDWLHPLWAAAPTQAQQLPADPGAILDAARARWQSGIRSHNGKWPAADPLEIPSAQFLKNKQIERQQAWPDALLARHWIAAHDAIASATTGIGLEAICEDQQSRFQIEAIWNSLWLSGLLAPLRAAATHAWANDLDSAAALEKASATTYRLTGYGPHALLCSPRVQSFIAQNLMPNLRGSLDSLGAASGEAGFDLIREARLWHRLAAPISFEKVLTQPDPPPQPQPVYYWNQILAQADLPH